MTVPLSSSSYPTELLGSTERISIDQSPAKVFLIGQHNVGKTALLKRFCEGTFESTSSTESSVIKFQEVALKDGSRMTLQIWDTIGQKKCRIPSGHSRGIQGVIIVFDLSNPASFQTLPTWIKSVAIHISIGTPMLLVGAKKDLVEAKSSDDNGTPIHHDDELRSLIRQLGIKYIETSSKEDVGVEEAFVSLAEVIRKRRIIKRYSAQYGANTSEVSLHISSLDASTLSDSSDTESIKSGGSNRSSVNLSQSSSTASIESSTSLPPLPSSPIPPLSQSQSKTLSQSSLLSRTTSSLSQGSVASTSSSHVLDANSSNSSYNNNDNNNSNTSTPTSSSTSSNRDALTQSAPTSPLTQRRRRMTVFTRDKDKHLTRSESCSIM